MKNHYLRTSSILAVLTLFVGLAFSSTAQEPIKRQPQPAQEEIQLPELAVQELDAEMLRIAAPRQCHGIAPVVQIHDINDGFAPTGSPVTLSSALTGFLTGKPVKGYDNAQVNKIFADSFKLRSCRVCYATLEVRIRGKQDQWTNDSILAGAAPFTTPLRFIGSANLWSPTTPNPKTLTLGITSTGLANLNLYLATGLMPPFLDIVAQDDTDFDYAKLSVWYY